MILAGTPDLHPGHWPGQAAERPGVTIPRSAAAAREPGTAPCRNGPLKISELVSPAPFFFILPCFSCHAGVPHRARGYSPVRR
jgi:hypothetical protein